MMIKLCSATIALLLGVFTAQAQSMPMLPETGPSTADPSIKLPQYEVASVKPHKGDDNMMSIQMKQDGFAATNLPLTTLITNAYGIRQDLISGGPGWVDSARFDVNAKVAGEDVETLKKLNSHQRASLLQAVLTDRFKLKLHTETRSLPVYDLVLAKGGAKLKASDPETPLPPDANPADRTRHGSMIRMAPGEFTGQDLSMKDLTTNLAGILERTVIDKTGLTGKYDFSLKWTPEEAHGGADAGTENGPTLFTAVQEQLGLKLVPTKGPVETLVIDHAEMPTEN